VEETAMRHLRLPRTAETVTSRCLGAEPSQPSNLPCDNRAVSTAAMRASRAEPRVLPRLALMMFLQYAVWGAWLPVAARYLSASTAAGGLGFSGYQIGLILGLAGSIGAVSSPFIAGQLADRHLRTEHCLAVLAGAGGVVKWLTSYQTSYAAWLVLSIAYSVLYMPTLALTNSLALAHLGEREREFPLVRLWGTVGWIAVAWVFPMIWLERDLGVRATPPFLVGTEVADVTHRLVDALKLSGALSIAAALYALTLPATPPRRDAAEPLAFAKAFRLLRRRSFAVLVAASVIVSVIHQVYFLQTSPFLAARGVPDAYILPAMSVGQIAEIGVMAILGRLLARLGFRRVVMLGAAGYALRYAFFGTTALPLGVVVASQLLHGICYACFFAAAFIYVDRIAEADVRHSAQTVFGITILGAGPVVGGWLSGFLQQRFTTAAGIDYGSLWYTLAAIGAAATIFLAATFEPEPEARRS
jgi:nucleoside transporter